MLICIDGNFAAKLYYTSEKSLTSLKLAQYLALNGNLTGAIKHASERIESTQRQLLDILSPQQMAKLVELSLDEGFVSRQAEFNESLATVVLDDKALKHLFQASPRQASGFDTLNHFINM